jgi:hypothetical protein
MKLFNRSKKTVPDELPDLALEENNEKIKIIDKYEDKKKPKLIFDESNNEVLNEQNEQDDSGFFKEVMSSLVKDTKNLDKIESFYNNRFMTEDIVDQMKSYWENKKPELLLKSVGKDLKVKIAEQTEVLHKLEHEWQDIYFALLNKEEQIRDEEKELKQTITEFMDVCKRANKKRKN